MENMYDLLGEMGAYGGGMGKPKKKKKGKLVKGDKVRLGLYSIH